jgi:ribulose-bisphosphate carboxylase large chain
MNAEDVKGFFASRESLDMEQYLVLDYYLESVGDIETALAHFCSEQSTAQWKRVGVDEDFRLVHAAKVIDYEVIEELEQLSYPVKHSETGKIHACRVTIAHPHCNFGPKIPNLLTAVCGEGTYFTPGVPVVKLMDIHFPDTYLADFEGRSSASRGCATFSTLTGVRSSLGSSNQISVSVLGSLPRSPTRAGWADSISPRMMRCWPM